jgi:uncharacterized glyoxalase superfamily protein PhnB
MLKNRSVPPDLILPHVTYRNVAGALAWLTRTFGFVEHYRYGESDGSVQGAQMRFGDAWIMLTAARSGRTSPQEAGYHTQSLTLFVEDVDAHFERVRSAGAAITEALHETIYGERQFGVEDLEGHPWLFSRHVKNISPEAWGATLAGAALGHSEWVWTPRSYSVQPDTGAVTGAQASLYTRAKVTLEQSLTLLEGLYPLGPHVGAEDLANVRTVVHAELTSLLGGLEGAALPRFSRVDELFALLLGSEASPRHPNDLPAASSLGLLRRVFGLNRGNINTVNDEQNLTNFLILADYVISLQQSWNRDRGLFLVNAEAP